ncbi:uncharacterized protein LOC142323170 isoform X3 [Lycorma delicatula]|uniref:uncharacterized protein LOC142323170 isoform X3 n=1 Tax=Lycorma delicatula TaxID=130591 RepID=UPI003F517679
MERLYAVIQMISLFEVFLFNVFLTIAFMVWFPNVEAGVWTFLSAPLNLGVIHLHHLYLSDKISDWHDDLTLGSIMKLGFISFVISCGCAFWHVFAYCYYDSNKGLGKDENGIKKPVCLPYQTTKLGFGYNKKEDDLWWEKMFDDAAKNINISVEKTYVETEKSEDNMSKNLKKCSIHESKPLKEVLSESNSAEKSVKCQGKKEKCAKVMKVLPL